LPAYQSRRFLRTGYPTGGSTDTADTYETAQDAVRAQYPGAEIGHDGDLDDFGDRTLCWASEADSIDDDGANAIASIYRR
jgi:hypothetical protein